MYCTYIHLYLHAYITYVDNLLWFSTRMGDLVRGQEFRSWLDLLEAVFARMIDCLQATKVEFLCAYTYVCMYVVHTYIRTYIPLGHLCVCVCVCV